MAKKTVVLVGIYLEGIYPRGDNAVEANLLAPVLLKASAEADPEIAAAYDIKVLNLPASLSCDDVARLILDEKPAAVGWSIYVWNIDLMAKSAEAVHAAAPSVINFVGGPEVTYTPIETLAAHPYFDIIIRGSGEARFKDFLRNDLDPEKEPQICGMTYRNSAGEPVVIQKGPPEPEDLSKIPSPYQTGIIDLNDGNRHCVFIETYRGCIFKCAYCMWMGDMQNRQLNTYPIEQVLADIEIIYNNPNVAAVVFTDACIFYTKERAKMMCEKINSCKYKIPTILTLDIAFMNDEALQALKVMDLSHQKYHFGMQSVNLDTMKKMNRKIGPKLFKKRVEMMRSLDPELELSLDLIYGLAGDDFYTFRKTVDFALSLSPIKLNMSPLILLPGSTYWNEREKHGFVYEPEPPFLVHSNDTYSADDMWKTRRFVLGVIMTMYYDSIRDVIYAMTEEYTDAVIEEAVENNDFKEDFSSGNGNGAFGHGTSKKKWYHSRVGLIENFIERFQERSDLMLDVDSKTGAESYSVKEYDYIRQSTMDLAAEPINGLHCYEIMAEILNEAGKTEHMESIEAGIQFYRRRVSGESVEKIAQDMGQALSDRVKFGWVVSSEAEVAHEYTEIEVPKTESGGVGAMC